MSIRKVKVNAKLVTRKVKHQDTPTKVGLSVAFGFILPCLTVIASHVLTGDISSSFGIMG